MLWRLNPKIGEPWVCSGQNMMNIPPENGKENRPPTKVSTELEHHRYQAVPML